MATESSTSIRTVLVCQGRTCRSDGSARVLAAFQAYSIPEVTVVGCGCLGQCGNGPMVLIVPKEIWYSGVRPDQVPIVVEQHWREGSQLAQN